MLNPEQYRPRKVREPVESGTATGDGEDCMEGSDTKRSETSTRPPSTATQLGRSPVRSWLSALNPAWYRDLYTIGSVAGIEAVLLRVTLAVGAPLIVGTLMNHPTAGYVGGATALFVTQCDIGESAAVRLCSMFAGWTAIALGGTVGHLLGETPYSKEVVVLLCTLVAGWASGSHPGIAQVMRFFALAAAAATGLRFSDPHVLLSVAYGGASAFASAYLTWRCFGIPPCDNVMDWRSGVRRAFQGAGADIRFALCYSAAAGVALFAPSRLGIKHSFWATLVILMVMRREGTASFRLTLHYALGTVLGVLVAGVFLRFADTPLTFAVLATAVAVFSRVGFAINPSLGYMSFTMFALAGVHLIAAHGTLPPHLLKTRLYDVTIGCILALVGTLAATYPRRMQAEAATGRNAPHSSVLEALLRPANHISGSRAPGDNRNPQTRSSCSLVDYASRYLR